MLHDFALQIKTKWIPNLRFKIALYRVLYIYICNIYCQLRWAAADGGINQYRINCLVGQNFLPKYPKHINNEMSKSFWPKFLAYQIKPVLGP